MGFQVSPGVIVTERDLTTIVPAVSTSVGAFAGVFRWGPLNQVILINDENQLVRRFGEPDKDTASSFFTAANFLSYGSSLLVVRVAGENARTANSGGDADLLIKNDDHYEANVESLLGDAGAVIARHPGALGNSIKVSICPSGEAFKKVITGVDSVSGNLTRLTKENLGNDVVVGSIIKLASGKEISVVQKVDDDTIELASAVPTALSDGTVTAKWEFADVIGSAPGTSSVVESLGGSRDELHLVIVDADGKISGTKGTVLERHAFLSKAADALKEDGSSIYYVNAINKTSQYIRWANHLEANWGESGSGTEFDSSANPTTVVLSGGADDNVASDELTAARLIGYDLFKNSELLDVSLVILGEVEDSTIPNHVIQNVCEVRKDCVAFISPPRSAAVLNAGSESDDIVTFRNTLASSSYAVMDSGWKLQFDKYNDVERWVPLSGDVAGLCARTDQNQDPWWSPAGYNRGNIKNVIKLSHNPNKAERDLLYVNGVNPVLSIQGQGTVLFGDKTLLSKPSAFDRINVRRLFIVLEKAIATAAKFMLFEFNDEFTRQQFKSLVEPFLRDVQGRRGIYEFKVVCDSTNNTSEVIDRNEFIGDIYIKPARSINFIQLNFVAVRSGVDFSEIVGKI